MRTTVPSLASINSSFLLLSLHRSLFLFVSAKTKRKSFSPLFFCSGGDLTTTMGTAVLRSHDCLKGRLHLEAYRPDFRPMKPSGKKPVRSSPPSLPPAAPMKPARMPPARSNRSSPPAQAKPRSNRRVSFAEKEDRMVVKVPSKPLVMEEVTILKRGEDLKQAVDRRSDGGDEPVLCSTVRIGPEPEILPKQIRFTDTKPVYAGPGFFSSPAPSSLPFPALLVKRVPTDEATRGLRGLLRLDGLP